MPGSPVKIGPFGGGLNTYSEPGAVGDNEAINLINFNVDLDGSVFSRPPIRTKDESATVPGAGELKLLGFYIDPATSIKWLIASTSVATYARRDDTGVWSTITATFGATAFVQYQNKAYLVSPPDSANPGGSWIPSVFTAIAAMPKGASAVIYKERLFIAGGKLDVTNANRVFFSNAGDFATWTLATNFFDVRAGDGQHVIKIQVFQDTIITFKEDSTYAFSYDSSPSRGAVRSINTAIGCSNIDCVVEYENSLYVHHESSVYQLSNWNFTLINLKVPFEYNLVHVGLPTAASLSVLEDMLVVHHYDMLYIFGLRTGTWTKWEVDVAHNFNYFIKVPLDDASIAQSYYAGARGTGVNRQLYWWKNGWDLDGPEEITCRVTTKSYDFGVPYAFKRIFWWGVDLLSERDMQYIVHPITYTRVVTHTMMSAFAHSAITGTHETPLDISIDVGDSLSISNVAQNRMFIKLLKSLRFRQINFTLIGNTNGSSQQGPMRIYSITAFVDSKQIVPKEVN